MMDSPFQAHPKQHGYDSEIPYGYHGDKSSKLYAENEYLKERVKSCERGLSALHQLLVPKEDPPRVLTHYRSASLTMRSRSNSHTSPSPIPESHSRKMTESSKKEDPTVRVVTFLELKEAILKLVAERNELAEKLEDHRQITEAAKRERLLAIDEKDILLKESHELKTAIERVANKLKEVDSERKELSNQIRDLEKNVIILRRTNEESMRLRSIAIEERSKLIDECSQLQNELTSLQNERSELLDETLQLQSMISNLTNDKRAMTQRKPGGCHGYSSNAKGTRTKGEGGLRVKLMRVTPGQPWGFSVEGGRGSEFYRGDPSIVVCAVKENSPAHGVLFAGDCLLSIARRDLKNVTRKEAIETIRSCDQVVVDVTLNRVSTMLKPVPKEVKIPGKKTFGFSYETRVFVSGVEPLSSAGGVLNVGDEVTQVMGKSTLNMKPSVLKQMLKNCKDGVTMTIQSPTGVVTIGNGNPTKKPSRYSSDSAQSLGVQYGKRSSGGDVSHSNYPTPGTPGSSVSETSAGYHSLTHSMPSILSNTISPVAIETKTGQPGLEPVGPDFHSQSQLMTYPEEDSETSDSETPPTSTRYRPGAVSVMGSRQRPANFCTPRRNTLGHTPLYGAQPTHRTRTTSQSSFGPNQTSLSSPRGIPTYHPPLTPGVETTPTFYNRCKGTSLPRGLRPPDYALSQERSPHYDHFPSYHERRKQVISMSADNLDSDSLTEPHPLPVHRPRISRTMSQGNHMMRTSSHDISHGSHMARTPSRDCHMIPVHSAPKRRPISMSMGSMTNV